MEKGKDAPSAKKTSEKKSSKKRAVIFAAIVLALFILLSVISITDWDSLFKKDKNEDRDSWIHYYEDKYFKTPNYDLDITQDEEYMTHYNLIPRFNIGSESLQLPDVPSRYKEACTLISDYIDLVKRGDYENYYSLFTESYANTHSDVNFFTKKALRFTGQKLYDISVTLMRSQYLENGDTNGDYAGYTVYYFNVSYCIKDNDGTFRRDILSDESRTLLFEILEKDDSIKINDILFYRSADNKK